MRLGNSRWWGLLAAATLVSGTAVAGVKEGVDAWQAGDYAKAVAEWRAPAEKGDADGQFNLGQAYKLGRGVSQDSTTAQGWYLKAAQQGHEQAQANLGLMLFQNGDCQSALPWIRKAADRGEPRAQYVLGTAMFNGDLVPKDWPRAYALMTRAAASGLSQASTSMQQMEQYLSPADRQNGVALAREMEKGVSIAAATIPSAASTPTPVAKAAEKPGASVKPVDLPPSAIEAKPATTPAAKVATAKPAPKTAPKPVVAQKSVSGKGWKVQLGAFGSESAAKQAWTSASAQTVLAGLTPIYTPVNALTRLQAGPIANRAEAGRVCSALQSAGLACFPVAP